MQVPRDVADALLEVAVVLDEALAQLGVLAGEYLGRRERGVERLAGVDGRP